MKIFRIKKYVWNNLSVFFGMKRLRSQLAVTMIELLVGLTAATIVSLTIGVLMTVAQNSEKKTRDQAQIYNDITYAFALVQNRVHAPQKIEWVTLAGADSWTGQQLRVLDDSGATRCVFGLQRSASTTNLVFVPDDLNLDAGGKMVAEVIASVTIPDTINFSVSCSPIADCSSGVKTVTVTISGKKNTRTTKEISFNLTTTVKRRI